MYNENDLDDSIYTVDLSFDTGGPPKKGGKY